MRIDIKEYLEEKLLKDSAVMGMSPTQYIHYLVEHYEVKQAEKTIIQPQQKIQRMPGSGFVSGWRKKYD
jgi:hypothetical protein